MQTNNPFKIGDIVRRTGNNFYSIRQGDIGEVVDVSNMGISLKGHYVDENSSALIRFNSVAFALVRAAGDAPLTGLPPAPTLGRKDDSGKLAMNLLDDMPNALKAVVEVMQWAVTDKKPVPYERGSWQGVHADRYREAFKRHDQAACEQEVEAEEKQGARFQRDAETNLLHLAHIATSALMALENTIREIKGKQ